ncbi:MAG: LacI family DNA-binding transcriptional regulator [Bacilli bacterium]|nr:LacI family DNA-binding transcriptional regulator [Bacilli bacterium]
MRSPTIRDVAIKSGVGVGTVSRVINNSPQISEKTRKRVLDAIKELGYVPNVAGKRLSQNRSYVIAVIVPVIDHPFFSKLIAELELAADEKGYSLLVASSQHRIEKEREILRRLAQNEADGALFVTHYEHQEKEFENLAIVTIDRHLGKDVPIVTTNNYEGTKEAIEYLIEKGCKKVAFIGTKPNQASEVSLREKAYLDVMKDNQMEPILVNEIVEHGQEKELVKKLFANYPNFDGVFVSGCTLADVLYREALSRGIKVPSELQIISYDGDFSTDHHAHMSTLEQPLDLIAKKCVELIIDKIKEEKDINLLNKFDCRFIKCETTK